MSVSLRTHVITKDGVNLRVETCKTAYVTRYIKPVGYLNRDVWSNTQHEPRDDLWTVDCVWNMMAHAQKPYFIFRKKRTSSFKSAGASVQSTTGSRGVCISSRNAGYTMFRGSVKGTGYPLHSPASPSLAFPASPCAITFQLDSTNRFFG